MFKKNTKHQQPALINAASELPEKQRKRLEKSHGQAHFTRNSSAVSMKQPLLSCIQK